MVFFMDHVLYLDCLCCNVFDLRNVMMIVFIIKMLIQYGYSRTYQHKTLCMSSNANMQGSGCPVSHIGEWKMVGAYCEE
ncbi:hypothetical protein L2E82_01537 [Cichorium intybus]|uniref:Uncharacterized protein n=1 Tax=Cichorium intybus TaxID=13427 RepID=A0ACB9GZK6_CICIN|nr:hypothetical protein L2E82_01537 [Cichorium intybus]